MAFTGFDTFLTKLSDVSIKDVSPPVSPTPQVGTRFVTVPFDSPPAQMASQPIDNVMRGLKDGPKLVGEILPLANNSLDVTLSTVNKLTALGYADFDGEQVKLTERGQHIATLIP